MVLPEALENRFEETLHTFEQEEQMPYVTHIERKDMQRGEALVLKRLLRRRFGELPKAVELRLDEADTVKLEHGLIAFSMPKPCWNFFKNKRIWLGNSAKSACHHEN